MSPPPKPHLPESTPPGALCPAELAGLLVIEWNPQYNTFRYRQIGDMLAAHKAACQGHRPVEDLRPLSIHTSPVAAAAALAQLKKDHPPRKKNPTPPDTP